MSRKGVAVLTVGIWIGIVVAGLWPFNFVPKNQRRWLPGAQDLGLTATVKFTALRRFSPRRPGGAVEATIELVFTPSQSYSDASTIFSLAKQDVLNFAIGQSVTDLFLQGSFTQDMGMPVEKLWIDDVCGQAKELFVTATLGTHDVDIYLDGQMARSFPVSARADNLSGTAFVGHNVKGRAQWSGSLARLAIFEGTLNAAEVSRRYEHWTKTRHLETDVNYPGAAYEFVTPARDSVSSAGKTGPNLIVPKTLRLSKPIVLEWPDHFNCSAAVDAVVNIAGFIPFGLFTCLCLRFWTGRTVSRCVVMTILVGASVSLIIELLQVFLPTRDSSLADLVTNVLGTAMGGGAAAVGGTKRANQGPSLNSKYC